MAASVLKHPKLAFFLDTASFFAFMVMLGFIIWAWVFNGSWIDTGIVSGVFAALKSAAHAATSARVVVKTQPELGLKPIEPKMPPLTPVAAPVVEESIPVLRDVVAYGNDYQPKQDQFRCLLLEGTPNKLKAPLTQEPVVCLLDDEELSLCTQDPLGQAMKMQRILKSEIQRIQFQEWRNGNTKHFKLFTFVTFGLLAGLVGCAALIIFNFYETQKWPAPAYAITTILPLLAISTFGGLLLGLLKPRKKYKLYILLSVVKRSGKPLQFLIPYKQFAAIADLFTEHGIALQESNL